MIIDLENLVSKYDLKINGILHIGAHYGGEIETYEKLGISNLIFFEPSPETFKILQERVGTRAIVKNIALGNTIGEIEMNVETANLGASNSILKPKLHLAQYPYITFDKKIKVGIDKLDSFLNVKDKFNFINIDVQGYELEVFKGGNEYLNHIDYIMTEVNRDELYENCVQIEELDNYLGTYGFERVETSWWDGGNWGDAFYIKK